MFKAATFVATIAVASAVTLESAKIEKDDIPCLAKLDKDQAKTIFDVIDADNSGRVSGEEGIDAIVALNNELPKDKQITARHGKALKECWKGVDHKKGADAKQAHDILNCIVGKVNEWSGACKNKKTKRHNWYNDAVKYFEKMNI